MGASELPRFLVLWIDKRVLGMRSSAETTPRCSFPSQVRAERASCCHSEERGIWPLQEWHTSGGPLRHHNQPPGRSHTGVSSNLLTGILKHGAGTPAPSRPATA